jgi:hypothetical protein
MLPIATEFVGTSESELLALLLSVLVGGVVVIACVGALLGWAARRRHPRLPTVTPLDDKVADMWARQLQMPRPFVHRHSNAA